jgi:hypothetical protein
MTVEGAWEVLGRRGERLHAIAEAIRCDTVEDSGSQGDLDRPWPLREVFGDRLSPELDRWTGLAGTLQGTYRGDWEPAVASSVTAAADAEDGTWLARLQGLFLPVSAVLVEDEVICHATWTSGPEGTSLAYYTHQDEPGFWLLDRSLAGLLAWEILEAPDDWVAPQPTVVREQWERAITLLRELPEPTCPDHLSVEELYPRTGWIVETPFTVTRGVPFHGGKHCNRHMGVHGAHTRGDSNGS